MGKITFQQAKELFGKRGYKLLETEYKNSKTKMKYICPNHPEKENSITYNNLSTGYGCAYCAGTAKYTFDEAAEEFFSRGYTLLETTYKNNKYPMKYRCSNHPDKDLKITLHKLLLGQGCVYCRDEKRAGEGNSAWKGGVTDMSRCLRGYIRQWKKEALQRFDHKCYVTGRSDKLEIHHTKPFHELRDEVFTELNLPIHDTIGEYSQED